MNTKAKIKTKYFIPPLTKESVVISGGGFLGEWDYYIYKTFDCSIYIAEPFPGNYIKLKRLFGGAKKVKVFPIAFFNKDDEVDFHLIGKNNGHSLYDRSHDRKVVEVISVETMRLKTFMLQEKISKVDLLKLNVEGAEVEILQDLDEATACRIKHICFSSHERKITTSEMHKATLRHLIKIGYKVKPYSPIEWVAPDGYFGRWVCTYEDSVSS